MIRNNKLIPSILCTLLLVGMVTACAPASTPAAATQPPSPTALQFPTNTSEPPTAVPPTAAPATNAPTSSTANASGEVTGASLYQLSCEACHGADLKGSTFTLDGQTISVPALTWSDLTSTYQTDPSRGTVDQQVAISITKGLDETGGDLNNMMPRWSALSQAQVDSLVQYLQTTGTAGGSTPTLTTAATGLMGQQLYVAACAACHGQDGAGLTFDREGNKIETPSLHWSELTSTYSADPSRGTIAEQVASGIIKGLDEKGGDLNPMMPRWSSLTQAQVDSLVQFLQTAFP